MLHLIKFRIVTNLTAKTRHKNNRIVSIKDKDPERLKNCYYRSGAQSTRVIAIAASLAINADLTVKTDNNTS